MVKKVGTFVPVFSLWSEKPSRQSESGTFAMLPDFFRWLSLNGQSLWQTLPLHETHFEPGSVSRRAASPYRGYGVGIARRFMPPAWRDKQPLARELAKFVQAQRYWLDDYALHQALSEHFGTDDWTAWPKGARDRDPKELHRLSILLKSRVREEKINQWRLHAAYAEVRRISADFKISHVGDLSFYIPLESPLVWSNRDCFVISKTGKLRWVSGMPKGTKGHYGRQVWGHPLYNWANEEKVLKIWRLRLRYSAQLYDVVRLDHVKGFVYYGAMSNGGRGHDHIEQIGASPAHRLGTVVREARRQGVVVFGEDAGARLDEIQDLMRDLEVPGIRILRFAYNEKIRSFIEKYADLGSYPHACYAYSTTHDSESLVGYLRGLKLGERRILAWRLGMKDTDDLKKFARQMLRLLILSPARRVIIPMRDWIGSPARLNVPGTERKHDDLNWRHKLEVPIERLPAVTSLIR